MEEQRGMREKTHASTRSGPSDIWKSSLTCRDPDALAQRTLVNDATEGKRLREETGRAGRLLAGVIGYINDLVMFVDLDGKIITCNRAAEAILGLSAEQVKGRHLSDLCAQDHGRAMADLLQRVAVGREIRDAELALVTREGDKVPMAWSSAPMQDGQDEVTGIVAVGRDLRERRWVEVQRIQSAKMTSLGVMAAGIAHELRNPLGVIAAAAQLLCEQPDNAVLRAESLQKIRSGVRRASSIIENLLNLARPPKARQERVGINDLLEETLALLRRRMILQTVRATRVLQPDLPSIQGNRDLLQQVFTNMILNACDAMPHGGTLTVTTVMHGEAWVEIRIADTGHGIRREHLPKVFDPFFTTRPAGRGTGLGLSICDAIIQQHRGAIEVASEVGRGTTFTIRLPAGAPRAAEKT